MPIVELTPLNASVVALYNRMRGISWEALPVLMAIEGMDEAELVVRQLLALDTRMREDARSNDG